LKQAKLTYQLPNEAISDEQYGEELLGLLDYDSKFCEFCNLTKVARYDSPSRTWELDQVTSQKRTEHMLLKYCRALLKECFVENCLPRFC